MEKQKTIDFYRINTEEAMKIADLYNQKYNINIHVIDPRNNIHVKEKQKEILKRLQSEDKLENDLNNKKNIEQELNLWHDDLNHVRKQTISDLKKQAKNTENPIAFLCPDGGDSRLSGDRHLSLFIITKNDVIMPMHYLISQSSDMCNACVPAFERCSHQAKNTHACTVFGLVYAKALLKNDNELLKNSILYSNTANDKLQNFIPDPEVLKYSHSELYNKRMLETVNNLEWTEDVKSAFSSSKMNQEEFTEWKKMWLEKYKTVEQYRQMWPKNYKQHLQSAIDEINNESNIELLEPLIKSKILTKSVIYKLKLNKHLR